MRAVENLLGDNLFIYDDEKTFVRSVNYILETQQIQQDYIDIAKTFDWKKIEVEYEGVLRALTRNTYHRNNHQ
jgi:hypothetical protein